MFNRKRKNKTDQKENEKKGIWESRQQRRLEPEELKRARNAGRLAMKEAVWLAKESVRQGKKETKEKAVREAAEAREQAKKHKKLRKQTERPEDTRAVNVNQEKKEQDEKGAGEMLSGELFRGIVHLEVLPPVNAKQLIRIKEMIEQSPDTKIVLFGGSVKNGAEIVLSIEKSMRLGELLMDMPIVDKVEKHWKKIAIYLNSNEP